MSDPEFETLDIKQRIEKFSGQSGKDVNNNSKILTDLSKSSTISRSMPDMVGTKKPPVPPKPKPSPNKPANVIDCEPKVPPDRKTPALNDEITIHKKKSPTPKPRPLTTGFIPPKLDELLHNNIGRPSIPIVCVDSDSTVEHLHETSCFATNKLKPDSQTKPRRLSDGVINSTKYDMNYKITSGKITNLDEQDPNSYIKSYNDFANIDKDNVLKNLSAGPPSQPLPITPALTAKEARFSLPSLPTVNKLEISNSEEEKTSIKQKKSRQRCELAYEVNDIDPHRTKSVNTDRRNTLDGVIFGDDEDEDPYAYVYEHSPLFIRRSEQLPSLNQPIHKEEEENIYGPVAEIFKDSLNHPQLDTEDSLYEDPDTIDFRHPKLTRKGSETSTDSGDDYESPYEEHASPTGGSDLKYKDLPDNTSPPIPPHKKNFQIEGRLTADDSTAIENSDDDDDDDDDDYDTPDEIAPPSVPSHGKTLDVSLEQYDNDSDSPEYTDPTTFCNEPPKSLSVKIPPLPSHKQSNFDKYDDFESPEYTDPTAPAMFSTEPPSLPLKSSRKKLSDNFDSPEYTNPILIPTEPPIPYKDRDLPPLPPHLALIEGILEDPDSPDYTDTSIFSTEPPTLRRNEKTVPVSSLQNLMFDKYDDFNSPDYTDSTMFSTEPPCLRCNIPPPVPAHRASQNIEENCCSSSDDEDDPDYTDPTLYCDEPPVLPGSHKFRNGSIYRPAQYLPGKKIPSLDEDDDDNSLDYTNPELAFKTKSPAIIEEEEIYSDEPLYQVYNDIVNKDIFMQNKLGEGDILPEENTDSLHFANFLTGGQPTRMLWAELPSVRYSGTLARIDPKERKRQEAIFEVISSEASYLKSLDILVTHFMMSKEFLPNPNLPSQDPYEVQILDRHEYHFLYSGISSVKGVSERFLKDLRKRQQESVMFSTISDIILDYAKNHFQPYIKYCSNQVFQDRTLQSLKKHNIAFAEALQKLETDPKCQNLSMQSFLMLPMQRITRLPLLVDAICSLCDPGSDEFNNTDRALKVINSVVFSCNEGARKMERTEEMYFIQKTLEFKYKPIPLVSASRWLVKKGGISCSYEEGKIKKYKTHLRSIFKGKAPFYLFLFTDLVILTKMRSEDNFKVVDYCDRSMLKVEQMENVPLPDFFKYGTQLSNPCNYAFTLIFLENIHSKTQEYHCFMKAESSEVTRWLEALNPLRGDIDSGEAIYEEWDSPQVQVVHPYQAGQSDELTLIEGDVISVLRKLPDGWAEGLRLRDDEKGWFPLNHTDEIDSKHMRAKNLMQRYRLLNASQNIVNQLSMR